MDDKPRPPRPPEITPKPTIVKDNISFSYRDLELLNTIEVDNIMYLTFMVRGEFIVQIKKFEYYEYLDYVFTQVMFLTEDGATCICDLTTPTVDILDENYHITAIKIDSNTEEQLEKEERYIKMYLATDLTLNAAVGYHDEEEHKNLD